MLPILLSISHNIFLTREERYKLISGESIQTIGVSLPVLVSLTKTSEPAEEVFCKYLICNDKYKEPETILFSDFGYNINLPQIPIGWISPLPPTTNKWRKMSEKEICSWYNKNSVPKNANYLKDIKDGGSEYLKFKYNTSVFKDGVQLMVVHYCELKTIEVLNQSLFKI